MKHCFFVSDLHGHTDRYEKLFKAILTEEPSAVFFGGDLLPSAFRATGHKFKNFANEYISKELKKLMTIMGNKYPKIFLILGNDDIKCEEPSIIECEIHGMWEYVHNRKTYMYNYPVYGYSYVPPTPFHLKDWERYDISGYLDPGCFSPEEGHHSVPVSDYELRHSTIKKDLDLLTENENLERAIFLFHSPPYKTCLDRADLDGKMINHVPIDVHIGSIAIKKFIEDRQPFITLHGHVHESARLTGSWKEKIGRTFCFSAAHDGPELSLVKFNIKNPEEAVRVII